MNLFKQKNIKPEEEWIWVEGYKGTDKDMKCLDYQYELGVQHDIPEGQEVVECESGYHLCLELSDVFKYYKIGNGNRFFKVKALVRKSDKERYGSLPTMDVVATQIYAITYNKLVAKSIIFESELTVDQILNVTEARGLPKEYQELAIMKGVDEAVQKYREDTLVHDGYSRPFASYISNNGLFNVAHTVGSQTNLSMDVKVLCIMNFYNKG